MNGPAALAGTDGARRIGQPADKKRRDPGAGEAFRRALQQEVGDGDAKAPDQRSSTVATAPAARALQRQLASGRRDQGNLAHHVDVVV